MLGDYCDSFKRNPAQSISQPRQGSSAAAAGPTQWHPRRLADLSAWGRRRLRRGGRVVRDRAPPALPAASQPAPPYRTACPLPCTQVPHAFDRFRHAINSRCHPKTGDHIGRGAGGGEGGCAPVQQCQPVVAGRDGKAAQQRFLVLQSHHVAIHQRLTAPAAPQRHRPFPKARRCSQDALPQTDLQVPCRRSTETAAKVPPHMGA